MIRNLKWHVFIRTMILEVLTVYKAHTSEGSLKDMWFFCAVICSMLFVMDFIRLFMNDED